MAEQIAFDRRNSIEIGNENGSCVDKNDERCIADVLMWIAPDSPAIEPALLRAQEIEDAELERFYEAVAEKEAAEKERELEEFYAGVARAEAKAEEERVAEIESGRRATEEQAEADAIRIGEELVQRTCGQRGGYYQYWTDPPQAIVTSCNAAPQASGNGRTGAVCRDGWVSSATGRGACSHHGGVDYWTY